MLQSKADDECACDFLAWEPETCSKLKRDSSAEDEARARKRVVTRRNLLVALPDGPQDANF